MSQQSSHTLLTNAIAVRFFEYFDAAFMVDSSNVIAKSTTFKDKSYQSCKINLSTASIKHDAESSGFGVVPDNYIYCTRCKHNNSEYLFVNNKICYIIAKHDDCEYCIYTQSISDKYSFSTTINMELCMLLCGVEMFANFVVSWEPCDILGKDSNIIDLNLMDKVIAKLG